MIHSDYWARVHFSKDGHVDDVGNEGDDDDGIGVDRILETFSQFFVAKVRNTPPIIHSQLDDPIDATIGLMFFEIVTHVLDEEDFWAT